MHDPTVSQRLTRAFSRHPVVAFVRHRKVITFYQQLHALLRAGIALPLAFEQLQRFAPDAQMQRSLQAVAQAVQQGATLGDALRQHAAHFDDALVELVAFAEEAGRLEPVLAQIIEHLEQVQRQRWLAIAGAMWPMYLFGALVLVGPLLTAAQGVTSGAQVGSVYARELLRTVLGATALISSVLGFPLLLAALDLDDWWDGVRWRVPFLSAPYRTLAASRLVMGLGLATASGMETLRALRLSARITNSPRVLARRQAAEHALRTGGTFTHALERLDVLDRADLGRISVAETTGTLDAALLTLSQDLQARSTRAMRALVLTVTILIATLLVVKVVLSLLGVLLGPVKTLYDAAGTGKLDGVDP